MIYGKRYMYPSNNIEINRMMEDVFDDSDERLVALIAYNTLVRTIYNSLPDQSKSAYYNFLYNNQTNIYLIKPKIEIFHGVESYIFNVRFYFDGKKYDLPVILCEPNTTTFNKTNAAYDVDHHVLYLPIIKDINKGINCDEFSTLENARWSITHEIKHHIDYLKIKKTNPFKTIPDPQQDTEGYYNHKIEYAAFCQEAVDYITKDILAGIEKNIDNVKYFSDQSNVKYWLDTVLLKHFDEINKKQIQRSELLDVATFYKNITSDKKNDFAKKIADFYKYIVLPKFESIDNIRNFLITVHKKAYKNPDYYLS